MYGIILKQAPNDWEIIQHKNGYADVLITGKWTVHPAAVNVGLKSVNPVVRVMREDNNHQTISWQSATYYASDDLTTGSFEIILKIPAGGLYRIETALDTVSINNMYQWMFRGDTRFHVGVGDVFIIAGQSNAAGFGKDEAYDAPDINVHMYRTRGCWDIATHPLNDSTGATDETVNVERRLTGTSPFLSFGKTLSRLSGFPVGLIPCAAGGAPMERWLSNEIGDLYSGMIDIVKKINNTIKAILWYQGCANTDPKDAVHYEADFTEFLKQTRKDLGYDIPIFTFQLNREINSPFNDGWSIVKEAQRQAAHHLKAVHILSTMNTPICDDVHNSSHGNVRLGEKLGAQCANVFYKGNKFESPDVEKVFLANDTTIRLIFSNVAVRLFLYSTSAKVCGFEVEDKDGKVEIASVRVAGASTLELKLYRHIKGEGMVSFATGCNPTMTPPVDEATYLPPLAFYKVVIAHSNINKD